MKFSIIIPTFNRRLFLEKAIDSVLDQTVTDYELIIVDDGSTDDTKRLIDAYGDFRLQYFFQENQGPASARNLGIRHACGEWIAFLDSDDWWLPQKLERTAEYIQQFPGISIFHTDEVWYRNGKLLKQKKMHAKPDGWVYTSVLPLCCISLSTAVIRKSLLEEIGGFDETFEACEDYDFWLRVTEKYPVKLIPEPLTEKDGGRPDELSVRVWGLDRFRIRALQKMLDSGSCDSQFFGQILAEFRKKCRIFAKGAEKRGRLEDAQFYRNLAEHYICCLDKKHLNE